MKPEAHPRARRQLVELDEAEFQTKREAAGQAAVGDPAHVRGDPELDVLGDVAGDVDVAACDVKGVEAVAVFKLCGVLKIAECSNRNLRILRLCRRRGRLICRRLRPGGRCAEAHESEKRESHPHAMLQ